MHKIKISTYIAPLTRLGSPELVVETLKKSGFDYFDFTMMFPILGFDLFYNFNNYKEKAVAFRKCTDKIGIYCNQTHGSVPCFRNGVSKEENARHFELVKRSIEVSHILGSKYCVLHPVSDCTMDENVAFFKSIIDIVHENEIVIAIENTLSDKLFGKPEDFIELLGRIDDESFKVCLDIGHAETKNTGSNAIDFINKLKDKIVCLHIHDNDKVYDNHQLPFTLVIEFDPIFKALKENNYSGDITFECGTYFNNMPVSLLSDALKFLHDVGKYIGKQIYN